MTHPHTSDKPCIRCGGHAVFYPYQDQGGCGSAIIELWRCQDCGHVEYGDVIGQASCDLDPNDDLD